MRQAIINYIISKRDTRSRYEIDKVLLRQGYLPEQIEEVWQLLSPKPIIHKPFLSKPELWIMLGSLVWAGLLYQCAILEFYDGVRIYWFLNVSTIVAILGLGIWWYRKKFSFYILSSIIVLVATVMVYTAGLLLIWVFADFHFGSYDNKTFLANHNNHLYKLRWEHACDDFCTTYYTLHRCEIVDWLCPKIASEHSRVGWYMEFSNFSIDENDDPKKVYIYGKNNQKDESDHVIATLTYR